MRKVIQWLSIDVHHVVRTAATSDPFTSLGASMHLCTDRCSSQCCSASFPEGYNLDKSFIARATMSETLVWAPCPQEPWLNIAYKVWRWPQTARTQCSQQICSRSRCHLSEFSDCCRTGTHRKSGTSLLAVSDSLFKLR